MKADKFPLRPLEGWAVLRVLTPEEVAAIERPKAEVVKSLILIELPRAVGEEIKSHRWCEVLRLDKERDDVKPGDKVFAWTVSGSMGPNDQWHELDGVKFFQMPVKDIMGVLEP
jgi:hypothetical protein